MAPEEEPAPSSRNTREKRRDWQHTASPAGDHLVLPRLTASGTNQPRVAADRSDAMARPRSLRAASNTLHPRRLAGRDGDPPARAHPAAAERDRVWRRDGG